MVIRYMFHKGWRKDPKFRYINFAVKLRTLGPYCHVETLFPDGVSWSSSIEDEGVRPKMIDYTKHPERWGCIEVEKTEKEIETMRKMFERIDGLEYDLKGIFLTEALPFGIDDENKWYCSETAAWVELYKRYHISPNTFWRRLKRDIEKGRKHGRVVEDITTLDFTY